jgi:hypothetical protein
MDLVVRFLTVDDHITILVHLYGGLRDLRIAGGKHKKQRQNHKQDSFHKNILSTFYIFISLSHLLCFVKYFQTSASPEKSPFHPVAKQRKK